jgi:hypothetical protein
MKINRSRNYAFNEGLSNGANENFAMSLTY